MSACVLVAVDGNVICPSYYFTSSGVANSLLQCRAVGGRFGVAGEPSSVCPQDSYCLYSSIISTPCPTGWYSNAGSTACVEWVPVPCRDGYYASYANDKCLPCPRGAYCHDGAIVACDADGAYWSTDKASTAAACLGDAKGCRLDSNLLCPSHTYVAASRGGLCEGSSFWQCRANAGFYFNFSEVAALCPVGFYCPRGTVYPVVCPVYDGRSCGVGYDAPNTKPLCPLEGMAAPLPICTLCSVQVVPHGKLVSGTCKPCCDLGYFFVESTWSCEALDTSRCGAAEYSVLPPQCHTSSHVECKACPLQGMLQLSGGSAAVGFGVHTCPYACAAGMAVGSI